MYDNKIQYVSQEAANNKISEYKMRPEIHTVVLDGKAILTWKEYIKQIERLYKFPTSNDNFDGYTDWMEDLSWLDKNGFALFIFNFDKFLSKEPKSKRIVMEIFDHLMVWWSKDADIYWDEGKTKPFNVYLIK